MSQVNQGQQYIGWKYQTPLQAQYLNTFLAGFSNPGLLTRPRITLQPLPLGMNVTVDPFSLLIIPEDIELEGYDENQKRVYFQLVKITTTSPFSFPISRSTIALGFQYSFASTEGGTAYQRQWYGKIEALTTENLEEFINRKGIIIATVQVYTFEGNDYYSVTTSGADISDALLMKEGWNPNQWLSVVHPKRCNGVYNQLEVRRHNDRFSGYVNGFGGLNKITEADVVYNLETEPTVNPDGIRGFMPGGYCAFKLQSDEFGLCTYGNTLPLDKTPGATFAVVDGSYFNIDGGSHYHSYADSFTNRLIISPVRMANTNSFFDGDTLYII